MTSLSAETTQVLLMCTVGGAPEPLVKALQHWRLSRVLFIPSQQTVPNVDVVLQRVEQIGQPLPPGCYRVCPVGDAEDLFDCLRVIRSLDQEVHEWLGRGDGFEIVADFTAGTKCLSAALALQARRWRCRFSYVGGARRTKEGVGIVETGSERVVHSANPWDALGYQAVDDAVTVFNHGGYAAASHLLDQAIRNAVHTAVKRELATLKALVDAYAAWDRFDHKMARVKFGEALKNRNDLTSVFPNARYLIGRTESHLNQVVELADCSGPTAAWVRDLLHNAQRRAEECRYEDAVARLYRAIEALAQIRLRQRYGIADTKAVPLDKLPEVLRSQWADRATGGTVTLGLQNAYEFLSELDDALGQAFVASGLHDDKRSPLAARNASILAHGFAVAGEKVYRQLWKAACVLADCSEDTDLDWVLPAP